MYYLLLDVGGTEIKVGTALENGEMMGEIIHYSACSDLDAKGIFENLERIISRSVRMAYGQELGGIGMAFPGPFDYEQGISLMKGLGKYDSIYGMSIPQTLKKHLPSLENVDIRFVHDVEAFAFGSYRFGKLNGKGKAMFVCIGTGAGSAFIDEGVVCKEKISGAPLNGWIYDTPYKDSIIDDYLSVRGLERLSQKHLGHPADGKELYEKCLSGDKKAQAVYQEFGEWVYEALSPFLQSYEPMACVFGGQISKSFPFFGKQILQECNEKGIQILLEPDTSYRIMQGLYDLMQRRKEG